MLFDNNIIKNKKMSLDRMIGPREYPPAQTQGSQVTQIDVAMNHSPDRFVEEDALQEPTETKLINYDQKQNLNPFGQFPRTFQTGDFPAVT